MDVAALDKFLWWSEKVRNDAVELIQCQIFTAPQASRSHTLGIPHSQGIFEKIKTKSESELQGSRRKENILGVPDALAAPEADEDPLIFSLRSPVKTTARNHKSRANDRLTHAIWLSSERRYQIAPSLWSNGNS
jgi:hypothetical protein